MKMGTGDMGIQFEAVCVRVRLHVILSLGFCSVNKMRRMEAYARDNTTNVSNKCFNFFFLGIIPFSLSGEWDFDFKFA